MHLLRKNLVSFSLWLIWSKKDIRCHGLSYDIFSYLVHNLSQNHWSTCLISFEFLVNSLRITIHELMVKSEVLDCRAYLHSVTNYQQDDLIAYYMYFGVLSYNNSSHSSIRYSQFFVSITSYPCWTMPKHLEVLKTLAVEEHLPRFQEIQVTLCTIFVIREPYARRL